MRLVDIGCGTGEDAIHFASRGINVTAVDVSGAMIAQLKSKSGGAVRCEVADMRTCPVEDVFDGVFSNSSALNYVPDLDWLGHIRLTPGAHFVFTTLGRFYPLESAVFMFKGQPRRALRRFKPSFRGEVPGVNFNVSRRNSCPRRRRSCSRRRNVLFTLEMIFSTMKMIASIKEKIGFVPQKTFSKPKKIASRLKMTFFFSDLIFFGPRKIVSVPEKIFFVTEKIFAETKTIVTAPDMILGFCFTRV